MDEMTNYYLNTATKQRDIDMIRLILQTTRSLIIIVAVVLVFASAAKCTKDLIGDQSNLPVNNIVNIEDNC